MTPGASTPYAPVDPCGPRLLVHFPHETPYLLAQPTMRRISGHAAMPVATRLELRKIERQFQDSRVISLQEYEGRREDEIGSHRDQRGDQIVLNARLNRSPEAQLVQFRIDETRSLRTAGYVDMTEPEVVVDLQLLPGKRMIVTQHACIAVAAERLLLEVGVVDQRRVDRQIDRTAGYASDTSLRVVK